jgi:hypothetical protein
MTSILKVDNIKDSADNQAISISGGVATFASAMVGSGANLTNLPVSGLGIGQTLQVLTGSRAAATTYTNSSGRPIFVMVVGVDNGSGLRYSNLTIDGVLRQRNFLSDAGSKAMSVSGIVPSGSTYKFDDNGNTFFSWHEIR